MKKGKDSLRIVVLTLFLSCMAAATTAQADESKGPEQRVSEGAVYTIEQLAAGLATPSLPDPVALLESQGPQARTRHRPTASFQDVWISDIGTLLYTDRDRDGYFAGISLSIDADTRYTDIDVFASIDLQRRSGQRERLHTSNNFTLYGNTFTDEYRIDIDLVRNYPIGSYNLFIDLHDASSGQILDRVSASEFSNLNGLPLESEEEDRFASSPVPLPVSEPVQNGDIRVAEFAGSSGTFLLAILGFLSITRGRTFRT